MFGAQIVSVASALPEKVRLNDWFKAQAPEVFAKAEEMALAHLFSSREGAERSSQLFAECAAPYLNDPFRGAQKRHVLDKEMNPSELETLALRRALDAVSLKSSDLDLIICVSFRPDTVGPGNAARVAQALQSDASVLNLEATCSGSFMALRTAIALVQSGQYTRVGIATSCSYSRSLDLSDTLSWFLGDGAGAMIVERCDKGLGFLSGESVSTTESLNAFRFEATENHDYKVVMGQNVGGPMRKAMVVNLQHTLDVALRNCALQKRDIDFLVINSPMASIASFAAKLLELSDDKTVSTFADIANVGPVLTVLNLYKALKENRIRPGNVVAIHAFGTVSNAGTMIFRFGKCAYSNEQ